MKDAYGHSAIHLACENGHVDVVKNLLAYEKNGPKDEDFFSMTNEYEKNCLFVAVEFQKKDCLQYLLEQLNFRRVKNPENKNETLDKATFLKLPGGKDKNAVAFYACKPKGAECLKLLKEHGVNFRVENNKSETPLLWAVSSDTISEDVHNVVEIVVDFILEEFEKEQRRDKRKALEELINHINAPFKYEVIEDRGELKVNKIPGKISDKKTALMTAAEVGNYQLTKFLLERFDNYIDVSCFTKHSDDSKKAYVDYFPYNAMKIALLCGNFRTASLFTQNIMYQGKPLKAFNTDDRPGKSGQSDPILNDADIKSIAMKLQNVDLYVRKWKDLAVLAGKHSFYFKILVQLIDESKKVSNILNVIRTPFLTSLQMQRASKDIDLIYKLIMYLCCLENASLSKPWEKTEVDETITIVQRMIRACFDAEKMSNERNKREVLCFQDHRYPFRQLEYKNDSVAMAQALSGTAPLMGCLEKNVSFIFSISQVTYYVNTLFYANLKAKRSNDYSTEWWKKLIGIEKKDHKGIVNITLSWFRINQSDIHEDKLSFLQPYERRRIPHLYGEINYLESDFIRGRYCPVVMFFLEGLSKVTTVALVTYVCLNHYDTSSSNNDVKKTEVALIVLAILHVLYEIGELLGQSGFLTPKGCAEYFGDTWNWFDLIGLLSILGWAAFRTLGNDYFHMYKALLATSPIFYSFGVLRYFSIWEPLGKLVLIVVRMTTDLLSYFILFLIAGYGFWVAEYSLLKYNRDSENTEEFGSEVLAFTTLFSSSFANYPESIFYVDSTYHVLGALIMILYIILAAIVLMNLIIARMSATFTSVDEKSVGQFHLSKADIVKRFLPIYESHPFCMLPAPLNAFLVLTCLVDYIIYKCTSLKNDQKPGHRADDLKRLIDEHPSQLIKEYEEKAEKNGNGSMFRSTSGTAADFVVGFFMSFVAPSLEFLIFYTKFCRSFMHEKRINLMEFLADFFELLFVFIIFVLWYPVYVISLLIEVVHGLYSEGGVKYIMDSTEGVQKVYYERRIRHKDGKKSVKKLKSRTSDVLQRRYSVDRYISLKVHTIQNIFKVQVDGNENILPVVKIESSEFANEIDKHVSGSVDTLEKKREYQCPDNQFKFPIEKEVNERSYLTFFIRDLAETDNSIIVEKKIDITQWLLNCRYEGIISLGKDSQENEWKLKISFSVVCFDNSRNAKHNIPELSSASPSKNYMDGAHKELYENYFQPARLYEHYDYLHAHDLEFRGNTVEDDDDESGSQEYQNTAEKDERKLIFRDISGNANDVIYAQDNTS